MSAPSAAHPLSFTQPELGMLAKTADALTTYLGRPVLAEVDVNDDGAEWVTFGSTLDEKEKAADEEERLHVQLGGKNARLLGQSGGLPESTEAYDCLFLLAIQLSAVEGERFVKIDHDGEESAWSDELSEVLPFSIVDEELPPPDDDEDETTSH